MRVFNTKDFGECIKKRRKYLGYTQKYISDFTGLSVTYISDLENGKKLLSLVKLYCLQICWG